MTNVKVHGTGRSNTIAIIISLDSDKDDADAQDTLKECAEQTAQFIQDFTPYYAEVDLGEEKQEPSDMAKSLQASGLKVFELE